MSSAKEQPERGGELRPPLSAPVAPKSNGESVRSAPFNADSEPYWTAAGEGRLVLQQCVNCHHIRFPPRHLCPKCWDSRIQWITSSGRGHVHSLTVVHRAPTLVFQAKVPYVIAVIDLDEGPRMVANIVGENSLGAQIGDRVEVVFEYLQNATAAPQFKRVQAGGREHSMQVRGP